MSRDPTLDHPATWYAQTADQELSFPQLDGDARTSVCIVGGGFTGLGCALELAQRGVDVRLLEAHRIGWGASGRNGGQVHPGQRRGVRWLTRRFGAVRARVLFEAGETARRHLRELIARHAIDCDLRHGLIHACHNAAELRAAAEEQQVLRDMFAYDQLQWLDRDAMAHALGTSVYLGGWRDKSGAHLHPLKLAQGMARAADEAGAILHERTLVTGVEKGRVRTRSGTIEADQVVIAANGMMDGLDPLTEARVMPINSFVAVTEPLDEPSLLPNDDCASDSHFVVRYWRRTSDGRLIFGGGEGYRPAMPDDIAAKVRPVLRRTYPKLAEVRIDHAWGGKVAITRDRLPYLRRRGSMWICAGYSGQGVALAPYSGHLVAQAITGSDDGFEQMAYLPCPPFPGGAAARAPLLALAMAWYALRDRF